MDRGVSVKYPYSKYNYGFYQSDTKNGIERVKRFDSNDHHRSTQASAALRNLNPKYGTYHLKMVVIKNRSIPNFLQ